MRDDIVNTKTKITRAQCYSYDWVQAHVLLTYPLICVIYAGGDLFIDSSGSFYIYLYIDVFQFPWLCSSLYLSGNIKYLKPVERLVTQQHVIERTQLEYYSMNNDAFVYSYFCKCISVFYQLSYKQGLVTWLLSSREQRQLQSVLCSVSHSVPYCPIVSHSVPQCPTVFHIVP